MQRVRYTWAAILLGSMLTVIAAGVRVQAAAVNKVKGSVQLNEENWHLMLEGEWMVEFFVPWCSNCQKVTTAWERFASKAASLSVKVAKIDVSSAPALSGRFFLTTLPTVYHVLDGEFRQYSGPVKSDALLKFIKQQQWKDTKPLPALLKPDSLPMTALAQLSKLSFVLKEFNARLQDEFGLPMWGAYAVFAVATLIVGGSIGLLLIAFVDFICPPKKYKRLSFSEYKAKSLDEIIAEIANDEIDDVANDEESDGDTDDSQDNEDNTQRGSNDEGGEISDGDESGSSASDIDVGGPQYADDFSNIETSQEASKPGPKDEADKTSKSCRNEEGDEVSDSWSNKGGGPGPRKAD